MWLYVGDAGNWAVARLLDSAARGDRMPGWAPEFGIVTAFVGALILLGLTVRAVWLRIAERGKPAPAESERPWWALKGQGPDPEPARGYRGQRRAPRRHPAPAHPPRPETAATQVIPRVCDDPEATAVLVRPRNRWAAR